VFLAERRKDRESHLHLSLTALAQSGDGQAIKKQLEGWEKEQ
jgi:hypothetical protein